MKVIYLFYFHMFRHNGRMGLPSTKMEKSTWQELIGRGGCLQSSQWSRLVEVTVEFRTSEPGV